MDALLVDGDELELKPDPSWKWQGPPVKVTVKGSHKITADGKSVIWEADILETAAQALGKSYVTAAFPTPGMTTSVQMKVDLDTMSASVKDTHLKIATIATTGTFEAQVVPAKNSSSADVQTTKKGTWSVVTQKQKSAFSAEPSSVGGAEGADNQAQDGTSAGDTAILIEKEKEEKLHFVAIQLEDEDGNKLAGQRVAITTPDGERHVRTLNINGATRVDGIRCAGDCEVTLLDWSYVPPVRKERNWIALDIVDEDGVPISGATVEITTPDGETFTKRTGRRGAVRVDGIESAGECQVRVLQIEPLG